MTTWTLTARWILPLTGPPLAGGVVTVADGLIAAVEPAGARPADLDLGNAAVLPGLVNAHTHLDLSGMRGLAPPSLPLPDWLRQVIRHRVQRPPEQIEADVRAGLAECVRTGTTLLADVSGDGCSWPLLAAAPVRSVVFRELLGLPEDRARTALDNFRGWQSTLRPSATCQPGVSPHAPYSVRASLYASAASLGLPLMTHLAESLEELELLAAHRGPFVEFLSTLGVWDPAGLAGGVAEAVELCLPAPHVLLAHGNYLLGEQPSHPAHSPTEGRGGGRIPAPPSPLVGEGGRGGEGWVRALPPHVSVVYCPRTHAAFGHSPYPLPQLLAAGVRVALGTDSLASNPDLDLLEEARLVRRLFPSLPGRQILQLASLAGAEALGLGDLTGSLTPGKSADLVAVPLDDNGVSDPHDLVLLARSPVSRVLSRGRWVAG